MGRPKKTETIQENTAELANLVEQNKKLLQEMQDLKNATGAMDPMAAKYLSEVQNIKKTARVDSDKILIRDFSDHKNISLWTKWGKRIGPMHQTNALAALSNFHSIGIMLSTKQPTAQEIEDYNNSPEGKKRIETFKKVREQKDASKKKGNLEKMLKQMADQYGLTMSSLAGLLSPDKVKSVREGVALTKES